MVIYFSTLNGGLYYTEIDTDSDLLNCIDDEANDAIVEIDLLEDNESALN